MMLVITAILLFIEIPFGIGFAAGCLLSMLLLKITEVSWDGMLGRSQVNKGAIFLNFFGKFLMMGLFLYACAKLPKLMNIFAGAAGLMLIKPAIIISELSQGKEVTDGNPE